MSYSLTILALGRLRGEPALADPLSGVRLAGQIKEGMSMSRCAEAAIWRTVSSG
jgi:hypothetical protein